MTTFKDRLNTALHIRNMKPIELSKKTGISKARISQYMSGLYVPKSKGTLAIATALDVSETWLMGLDVPMERIDATISKFPPPTITEDVVTFPVIGEVAAGYDTVALEDWGGDTIEIPQKYLSGRKEDDFFVLQVKGNSMYPLYLEGDKVLVLKQSTLNESGEIGVILYDGECATLKKVEYVLGEDWLKLIPLNLEYPPKTIEGAELELCKVIGIPKLVVREIK